MTNKDHNNARITQQIFDDPVSFLAGLGIEAEIVPDEDLDHPPIPAAA